MFLKRLLLLVVVFIFCNSLYSQSLIRFPSDSQKFLEEMTKYIMKSENVMFEKKDRKEFVEVYALEWNSGKFTDNHKKQIYKMCNFMLAKKMLGMAAKAGIKIFFVLNKVDEKVEAVMTQNVESEKVVAKIPQNSSIFLNSLEGKELKTSFPEIDQISQLIVDLKGIRSRLET